MSLWEEEISQRQLKIFWKTRKFLFYQFTSLWRSEGVWGDSCECWHSCSRVVCVLGAGPPGATTMQTPVTGAGELPCRWHTWVLLALWEEGSAFHHRAPFLWGTDCSLQSQAVGSPFHCRSATLTGQIFHTHRSRCTVYYIWYYTW